MDDGRFDDLARALGATGSRRAGLRAALGAALGLGLAGAALDAVAEPRGDAGAAKRRHECGPDAPCPTNFSCVKQGRKRRCVCGTVTCGSACCAAGEICQGGACVTPGPGACIEFAQPCKNVGVPCCEGLVCGSGQAGEGDVACYVPAGGACASTGDCAYGATCEAGQCVANPQPQPEPTVEPTPTAVPCVPNVEANGTALLAALNAAKTQPDSVISLGSGEYDLGSASTYLYTWDSANSVTVRVCPGETAVVKGNVSGYSSLFLINQGKMTFTGPGLTVRGLLAPTGSDESYGFYVTSGAVVPALSLKDVTVEDFHTAIYLNGRGNLTIDGGALKPWATISGASAYKFRSMVDGSSTCGPSTTTVVSGDCRCWTDTYAVCPASYSQAATCGCASWSN